MKSKAIVVCDSEIEHYRMWNNVINKDPESSYS